MLRVATTRQQAPKHERFPGEDQRSGAATRRDLSRCKQMPGTTNPLATPLITAKHTVPPLRPGAVVRDRLYAPLLDPFAPRLTVVIAPAGWGKTTLLSQLAHDPAESRGIAWVSLDEADDDPIRFWTYLFTALQHGVVGLSGTPLGELSTPGLDPVDFALPDRQAVELGRIRQADQGPGWQGARCTARDWCAGRRSRRTTRRRRWRRTQGHVRDPVAVPTIGQPRHLRREAAGKAAEDQVLHRAAEADVLLAVQRVDRPRPACSVHEDLDALGSGREGPRLGVVRTGREHGAGHGPERTGQFAPLRPGVERRTVAWVEGRGVVDAISRARRLRPPSRWRRRAPWRGAGFDATSGPRFGGGCHRRGGFLIVSHGHDRRIAGVGRSRTTPSRNPPGVELDPGWCVSTRQARTLSLMDVNPATNPFEVTLSGPVAASVVRLLGERYDGVTTSVEGTDSVLAFVDLDQAGERAVLNLLWDTGHQVRTVHRRG